MQGFYHLYFIKAFYYLGLQRICSCVQAHGESTLNFTGMVQVPVPVPVPAYKIGAGGGGGAAAGAGTCI